MSKFDNFWSCVQVSGEDDCWNWMAYCDKDGYGSYTHSGRTFKAHRTSFELTNGKIPDGLLVLHTCDNPPCCNPKHLFLGTNADNMRDMAQKGRARTPRPESYTRSGHVIIPNHNVREDVRCAMELGMSLQEIFCQEIASGEAVRRAWYDLNHCERPKQAYSSVPNAFQNAMEAYDRGLTKAQVIEQHIAGKSTAYAAWAKFQEEKNQPPQ